MRTELRPALRSVTVKDGNDDSGQVFWCGVRARASVVVGSDTLIDEPLRVYHVSVKPRPKGVRLCCNGGFIFPAVEVPDLPLQLNATLAAVRSGERVEVAACYTRSAALPRRILVQRLCGCAEPRACSSSAASSHSSRGYRRAHTYSTQSRSNPLNGPSTSPVSGIGFAPAAFAATPERPAQGRIGGLRPGQVDHQIDLRKPCRTLPDLMLLAVAERLVHAESPPPQ